MANANGAFDLARGDPRELAVRAGTHAEVVAVFPVDEIVPAAPSTPGIARDFVLLEAGSGQPRLALELHRPRHLVVGQPWRRSLGERRIGLERELVMRKVGGPEFDRTLEIRQGTPQVLAG